MHSGRVALAVSCLIALASTIVLTACDPSKALDKAFAKFGLTRLALVRTDMEPGAVIVSKNNNAIYADHIADYASKPTSLPTEFQDRTKEASAYIPKIEGSSDIEPSVAVSLLEALIPLDASADFKFTNT